jgi:hypothetical protein
VSTQPSNEEAADIFRVMLTEGMKMHPLWLKLKGDCRYLESILEKPGKVDKKTALYLLKRIREIFDDYEL